MAGLFSICLAFSKEDRAARISSRARASNPFVEILFASASCMHHFTNSVKLSKVFPKSSDKNVIASETKQSCLFPNEIATHPPGARNDRYNRYLQWLSLDLGIY